MSINRKLRRNKKVEDAGKDIVENKNMPVENYKIEDEAIMRFLKIFHGYMLNTKDKITVKKIIDTKMFNRDNASLFTLSLKDMLDEDFSYQELKGNKTATLIVQTLYNYFSKYFIVDWINREIGYGCYDKKMRIFTLYMNNENEGAA